ncbi:hypothetical protein ACEYW6_35910, partial [Nostoc sp. UIC 10607]|uniref:hypothetical protein n=1 Tax=Nostoc sp. UIC 10607 TaxID=3045935 RepID=UPI0039A28D5A
LIFAMAAPAEGIACFLPDLTKPHCSLSPVRGTPNQSVYPKPVVQSGQQLSVSTHLIAFRYYPKLIFVLIHSLDQQQSLANYLGHFVESPTLQSYCSYDCQPP